LVVIDMGCALTLVVPASLASDSNVFTYWSNRSLLTSSVSTGPGVVVFEEKTKLPVSMNKSRKVDETRVRFEITMYPKIKIRIPKKKISGAGNYRNHLEHLRGLQKHD
jgi:hypothetical protein